MCVSCLSVNSNASFTFQKVCAHTTTKQFSRIFLFLTAVETQQCNVVDYMEQYLLPTKLKMAYSKSTKKQNLPKLPDQLGEDVFQFGSEVPPHVVLDASNACHLSMNQRVKFVLN